MVLSQDEPVQKCIQVALSINVSDEKGHNPLGGDHLNINLEFLDKMTVNGGNYLLHKLLHDEGLQMVLIHLTHVDALQLLLPYQPDYYLVCLLFRAISHVVEYAY